MASVWSFSFFQPVRSGNLSCGPLSWKDAADEVMDPIGRAHQKVCSGIC